MLGPEIEGEIAQGGFGHNGLTSAAGSTPAVDCGFRIGRQDRDAAVRPALPPKADRTATSRRVRQHSGCLH
jgi:hypothetical protein